MQTRELVQLGDEPGTNAVERSHDLTPHHPRCDVHFFSFKLHLQGQPAMMNGLQMNHTDAGWRNIAADDGKRVADRIELLIHPLCQNR